MTLYLASLALLAAMILLAWVLAWKVGIVCVYAGEQWNVLSHVNERSSHARATSRLGGIALACGFFVPVGLMTIACWVQPHTEAGWGGNLRLMGWIMAGSGWMFVLGLADDVWDLPAGVKLAGQCLGALALVPADLRFLDLAFVPVRFLSPSDVMMIFSVVWVVFFVNAFNFMDGMDGFALRFTMHVCSWSFATVIFKSLGMLEGGGGNLTELRLELLMIPILGSAAAGFYKVNRPPAKVFMGDGGSHLLGYLLAVFVILGDGQYVTALPGWPETGPTLPAGAVWIFMLPFIFDPVVTLIRRARLRQNLLAAHRSHLYQRLMICGKSHREVLLINLRYMRVCGLAGFLFAVVPWAWARAFLGVAAVGAMTHYWLGVLKEERRVRPESVAGTGGAS